MFTRKKSRVVMAVLVALTVAVFAQPAAAVSVTYTETFGTDADPFPGESYPAWTVASSTTYGAYNVASGVLHHTNSTTSTTTVDTAYVTANTAFGVADFGSEVVVSADLGCTLGAQGKGNFEIGLRLGNLIADYLPGYNWNGSGMFRFRYGDDTVANYSGMTIPISFVPTASALGQHMSLTAVKNGSNWDVTTTITEGASTWTDTRSFTDSDVTGGTGVITKAGYKVNGAFLNGSDLTVDNFQVQANVVPEPSALLLLSVAGLLAYAWRKRK